jgi:hypothetical protein
MAKIDNRKSVSDNLAAFGFTHKATQYKPYKIPYGSHELRKGAEFIGYFTAETAMDMLRKIESQTG